jgi:transketolase
LIATREAYGTALVRLGDADPAHRALDGDTKNSTFADKFFKKFPERSTECFIAEQNLVAVAIGFGTRGHVPFASTFAAFFTRAADQIRVAGISQSNIKLVGSHVGISIGEDGPSQMALEDLAMMRAVVGSTVLYPADAVATEKLLEQMAILQRRRLPAHLAPEDTGHLRQRRTIPHRRRESAARRRQSHHRRRGRHLV